MCRVGVLLFCDVCCVCLQKMNGLMYDVRMYVIQFLCNSFQIEKWLNMFEHFERLDNYHVISNWLLIDQRPFKHYVLNQCSKWGNLYKDHLLNYVLNSLNVSILLILGCQPSVWQTLL